MLILDQADPNGRMHYENTILIKKINCCHDIVMS